MMLGPPEPLRIAQRTLWCLEDCVMKGIKLGLAACKVSTLTSVLSPSPLGIRSLKLSKLCNQQDKASPSAHSPCLLTGFHQFYLPAFCFSPLVIYEVLEGAFSSFTFSDLCYYKISTSPCCCTISPSKYNLIFSVW